MIFKKSGERRNGHPCAQNKAVDILEKEVDASLNNTRYGNSHIANHLTPPATLRGDCAGQNKKGADCGHALWLSTSANYSSGVPAFALRRWRRFISPRIDVTINCASLSPSSFNNSASSKTSSGILAVFCRDLLLVVPVAIPGTPCIRWESLCTKKRKCKPLRWESLCYSLSYAGDLHLCRKPKTTPRSAGTLAGRLTTTLSA